MEFSRIPYSWLEVALAFSFLRLLVINKISEMISRLQKVYSSPKFSWYLNWQAKRQLEDSGHFHKLTSKLLV